MSVPGETFPFLEHLQELPPKAGLEAALPPWPRCCTGGTELSCAAQSGFEIWVTSGSVTPQSRDGAFRLEAALSAQGITQQLALSFHGTRESPCTRNIMRCDSATAAKCNIYLSEGHTSPDHPLLCQREIFCSKHTWQNNKFHFKHLKTERR